MPELPEIEVLRRSLEGRLLGRKIGRVRLRSPALREPLDRRALGALSGARIASLGRRSKYLLIGFDDGRTLGVHLGMSGRLTVAPAGAPAEAHEHLTLELDSGERLRLRDPRRFGAAFVVPAGGLKSDPHLAHLGREPLGEPLTGTELARLAGGARGPVKSFVMDARRVVGVGNIYASEALFRAGIRPDRGVRRIGPASWERLARAVVEVLEQAIREGGTTLSDFTDGAGEPGEFQVSLAVYGRDGETCVRCAARRIRRIVQSGRSSYFCPGCQR